MDKSVDFLIGMRYNYKSCKGENFTAYNLQGGGTMGKDLELSYLLDFYGKVLTEKQRDVMEQYYNDDLSLSEIGENFGITRQGVRDSIKRGESVLLDLEEKVGFASRYRAIQSTLLELENLAANIQYKNKENVYEQSAEIDRDATRILEIVRLLEE